WLERFWIMHIPVKCRAAIMAGGGAGRQRPTLWPPPKAPGSVPPGPPPPKKPSTLFAGGVFGGVFSISSAEPSIGEYIEISCRGLADSRGARLEVLWEENALGTIGAARRAIGDADALLVVNVDNLTSLPLRALVNFHSEQDATLTIAA